MVSSLWRWCVVTGVVLLAADNRADNNDLDSSSEPPPSADNDDYLLKQIVWKRCHRKLSPACLKFSLLRTVEMMSKDSTFFLVPGVYFSCNSSETNHIPPEIARSLSSDHAPLDDLIAFSLRKYLRSLTLNVNLADFVSGGNETLRNFVFDSVTGRKKEGLGGYGAVAAMMGGMMATMMMAGLAALAGKALMTSLAALMMAAFAAMKGGGGGGGESKTYEVITKPVVSHINTHSSEVQHDHHGHYRKRSVAEGRGEGHKGVDQGALEDRYGWLSVQPGEVRYNQNHHSTFKGALFSSKDNVKNSGRSLFVKGNKGQTTNSNEDTTSKLQFSEHQPRKRSVFSPESRIISSQGDIGDHNCASGRHGHPRQGQRDFSFSGDQSLFLSSLFR